MCGNKFRCLLLSLLLLLSSCATVQNNSIEFNTTTPELPRSDVYYHYLLAQHYLQVNDIEKAVDAVLNDGLRTYDIMADGCTKLGTKEMGDAIAKKIASYK